MKDKISRRGFTLGIIFLFVGSSFIPNIEGNTSNENEITFIMGRITNLYQDEYSINFDAKNIQCIRFFPFQYINYKSGERMEITKHYIGIITLRFIFAVCGLKYIRNPTISMNIYSRNDDTNEIIWLVSGVEGGPIKINEIETNLLNESGEPQPDAKIIFNDVYNLGYINPGDTFTVIAPFDGYFVFTIINNLTDETMYKSTLVKY